MIKRANFFNEAWKGEGEGAKYLRPIQDSEIVLEYDNVSNQKGKELSFKAQQKLKQDDCSFVVYDHNGKSPHIHILIPELKDLKEDVRVEYKKEFIKKYSCSHPNVDLSLTSKRKLIAKEGIIHYKKYLQEKGTEDYSVKEIVFDYGKGKINKIDKSIIQKINNNNNNNNNFTSAQEVYDNDSKKDDILEYLLNNKIPKGMDRNNQLFSHIACLLVSKYPHKIEEYSKQIISNCPEESLKEFKGWIDKAKKEFKPFNNTNKKAINNWIKKHNLSIPLYKINDHNFILDENEEWKTKNFTFDTFEDGRLFIGTFLKRKVDNLKGGVRVGTKQKTFPVLIASDGEIIDVESTNFGEQYNIQFDTIPTPSSEMMSKWRLSHIGSFTEGKVDRVDKEELFKEIKEQFNQYLHFQNEGWYNIHTLWAMGTYFFQLFQYFPIFELRGISGTAKSKIMDISRFVSFNSSPLLVNPSASSIFRDTHELRYTKYVDEAERLFSNTEQEGIIELLNSSYMKGSVVSRVETIDKKFKTKNFQTYSPSMIASIKGLQGATEDRALIQITTRNPDRDNRGERIPNENEEIWSNLRNKSYLFQFQNHKEIKELYLKLREEGVEGLKKRQFHIWLPLLTLAKYIDETLYKLVLEFAQKQTEMKLDSFVSEGTLDHRILKKVKSLLWESKDEEIVVLNKEIIEEFKTDDKKKFPITITRIFNKFGFRDFLVHTKQGNGWRLSKQTFQDILSPVCPSLFTDLDSLPSHSSPLLSNMENIGINGEEEVVEGEGK